MKRSLIAILLLCPFLLWAKQVDIQTALQVAENFVNTPVTDASGVRRAPAKPIKLNKVAKQVTRDQRFYIFTNENSEGYVIVAADDIARPILGFADNGNVETMPENLRWWLSEYDREIKWALEQGLEPDAELQAEWAELKKAPQTKEVEITIGPLINTEWSQGTWYNRKCPYDSNKGSYCVTGCVATAMAQIMKYWNFPQSGRGSHSYTHNTYGVQTADFEHTIYDWANMPNDLGIFSSNTQINAIATLMYHCGVAVNMNYGTDASGAMSPLVPRAMRDYFWYSDEAVYLSKDDFTPAEWRSMLFEELWEDRPVFYSGGNMLSGGGHAFICDGWRSDDYFHFNWGWDESNGYYSLTSLKPTYFFISNGDYTANQAAIFNLYPKSDTISRYRLELAEEIYIDDSIPYGSKWHIDALVENVGLKAFSGYIYAVIEEENWLNKVCVDSVYFDSNNYDILSFDIDSAANLPVDRYYFSLMYRDSITGDLVRVCSDYYYYSNHVPVIVYTPLERADDYIFPDGWYYPNIYLTEDSIEITTAIRNTGEHYFFGEIALLFVNANDATISQYFDTISFESSSIYSYDKREISFKGILNVPEGNYHLYLLYRSNTTIDWELIEEADIFYNPEDYTILYPGSIQEYYIVAKRSSGNYFFFTPEKVSGKNRLVAVDAGTSVRANIDTVHTTADYLWTFEDNKLKNHNGQYLACTAAKSAIMNTTGTELTKTDNSDGSVTFTHAASETETWYLSLALAGNDYFVFYANANQFTHLLMLPKGQEPATPIQTIDAYPQAQKLLRDGQILILRGEKVYSITGQEVR